MGREKVIGLLWPDDRTERGRHLLSESLYVLRKDLGEDLFVTAGDEVGVNPLVLRCDAAEFGQAVEEGRLADAARLYRGPFLDGFYVNDAPEFERWAEGERDRLARSYARVLESLAQAAESAGRPGDAVEHWRRLAVHDPYDSGSAVRLMQALDSVGQRAAALWFADTHVALLREELEVEPDDDFAAFVERLRSEPVHLPPQPAAPAFAAPESPAEVPTPEPPAELVDADEAVVVQYGEPSESSPPVNGEAATAADPDWHAKPVVTAPGPLPPDERAPSSDSLASSHPETMERADARRPAAAGREWHRWARAAAVAGLLLGVLAAITGGPRPGSTEAAGGLGYDPRRIAVLYFDDHSRGGELQYLASGLTESLIHALSQVEALDVISRNGVKPYRDGAVLFDSMVADLRVGSVVEGSVQRAGENIRVTVQLVDAATRSHLESRTIVHPTGDLLALQDALADSVSRFLRRRLGKQVKVRGIREETRSAAAWQWVMEAEQARDDAARFLREGIQQDAVSAARALARADSLLAAAERADPGWARPTVLRGWVAHRAAPLAPSPAAREDTALAFAERALKRAQGDPLALELRGTVLFNQATVSAGGQEQAARLDRAEADLRAAVAADPRLASAWGTLSLLLRYRARAMESDAAARRALAEDAYLEGADVLLNRLFFSALQVPNYPRADSLCADGAGRFPGDWKFVQCHLLLLRADPGRLPDAARAVRLLGELDRVDPPARARAEGRAYAPLFRQAVVAAVVARSGNADSARAMLARARREAASDADLTTSLAYDAAYVHRVLGQPDSARALLAWAFARRPAMREFALRDPLFRGLALPAPRSP
ncbi:MAG TPA: BTAD domain-containing putative transcriptional regulator [Longimicrobium sp.]|uniref:BTAD domain-containing putative transcriptional regulator n=1 Tax=Longimicrobium sp. TaxID=2029185 RepID=UPI002ED90BBD